MFQSSKVVYGLYTPLVSFGLGWPGIEEDELDLGFSEACLHLDLHPIKRLVSQFCEKLFCSISLSFPITANHLFLDNKKILCCFMVFSLIQSKHKTCKVYSCLSKPATCSHFITSLTFFSDHCYCSKPECVTHCTYINNIYLEPLNVSALKKGDGC